MKRCILYSSVIFMCLLVSFSCRAREEQKAPASPEKTEEGAFPLNEKAPDSMIASVNNKVITRKEVDQEMDNLMLQYKDRVPAEQMDMMRPQLGREALENLINRELLLQEAVKAGSQAGEEAIDEQITKIASRYPTMEQFKQHLEGIGIAEEELRRQIGESLQIKSLLDSQISSPQEASEEEIETFYRENPDHFMVPEKVQASHILIATSPDEDNQIKEEKQKKLSRIRDEIINGADFAQMAKDHSDCPSKSQGGDLGYFERGTMVKPFEEAVFQLKVGEMSEIIETQFGYHLIKLLDHMDSHLVPLEEARAKILSYLNHQKKEQGVRDYLLKLRTAAKIEYSEGFRPGL